MTTLYFVDDRFEPVRIVTVEGLLSASGFNYVLKQPNPASTMTVTSTEAAVTPLMAVQVYGERVGRLLK